MAFKGREKDLKIWGYFLASDPPVGPKSFNDGHHSEDDSSDEEFDEIDLSDENAFSPGTSLIKSKRLKSCKIRFKEYSTGSVHNVSGHFPMVDPWWSATLLVRGHLLIGFPAYELRKDDLVAEEGVVLLFLKARGVEDSHRMAFKDYVDHDHPSYGLTFENIFDLLAAFSVNNKDIAKAIYSHISSVNGESILTAFQFPLLYRILPQLFPQHFQVIVCIGEEFLGKLQEALKQRPWIFGFSSILAREFHIHGCEASFRNFYHCSEIYCSLSVMEKDSLYIYEALKDICRSEGHTFVNFDKLKRWTVSRTFRSLKGTSIRHKVADWNIVLRFLEAEKIIVREPSRQVAAKNDRVYLFRYWIAEMEIAKHLGQLMLNETETKWKLPIDLESKHFDQIRTDKDQLKAAILVSEEPFVVLSGKGGCGKTEVVGQVIACARRMMILEHLFNQDNISDMDLVENLTREENLYLASSVEPHLWNNEDPCTDQLPGDFACNAQTSLETSDNYAHCQNFKHESFYPAATEKQCGLEQSLGSIILDTRDNYMFGNGNESPQSLHATVERKTDHSACAEDCEMHEGTDFRQRIVTQKCCTFGEGDLCQSSDAQNYNNEIALHRSIDDQDLLLLEENELSQSFTTQVCHALKEGNQFVDSQDCHEKRDLMPFVAVQGNQVFGNTEMSESNDTQNLLLVEERDVNQAVNAQNFHDEQDLTCSIDDQDLLLLLEEELNQSVVGEDFRVSQDLKLNKFVGTQNCHVKRDLALSVVSDDNRVLGNMGLITSSATQTYHVDEDKKVNLSIITQNIHSERDLTFSHANQDHDLFVERELNMNKPVQLEDFQDKEKHKVISSVTSVLQKGTTEVFIKKYILLIAPTGKAAVLLSQRAGMKGYTLHQVMYSYCVWKRHIVSQPNFPWKFKDVHVLIVDECSLVPVTVFQVVLRALICHAALRKVILLGDINQLPSIQPGRFLGDAYEALEGVGCSITLRTNHRSESEFIVQNADRILLQQVPKFDPDRNFCLSGLDENNNEDYERDEAVRKLLKSGKLPSHEKSQFVAFRRKDCNAINELCSLHYNNHSTMKWCNRKKRQVVDFRIGDKVCCSRNAFVYDHSKNAPVKLAEPESSDVGNIRLCNGEIFFIKNMIEVIGPDKKRTCYVVLSDLEREIKVDLKELIKMCKLKHAWARTIHTFQGSETNAVVYVVGSSSSYQNWQHVYTAVTRGRQQVHIVTRPSCLEDAVRQKPNPRNTSLKTRLQEKIATYVQQLSWQVEEDGIGGGCITPAKSSSLQTTDETSIVSSGKRKQDPSEVPDDTTSVKHARADKQAESLLVPIRRQLAFQNAK